MRGTDRLILVALPLFALVVGFYLLVVSPKQKEAGELQDQVDQLESSIQASETEIAAGEAARADFSKNYSRLVTLGRAVPEDDDQATLVYDLAELSRKNDVEFRRFELLDSGGGDVAAAAPAPAPQQGNAPEGQPAEAAPAAPAVATEATAALLPIGASVGPAGLPVTHYEFSFLGDFFEMADFFADVDSNVKTSGKGDPDVSGRLLTIDGFSLNGDQISGFPRVEANFSVTAYLVPAEQGLEAGATPAGPAPAGAGPEPTPVASAGVTP
jgi:hypothetical protein